MRADDALPLLDDAALPGGSLVLSRDELQAWLTEALGRPCSVTPRRLRYKAGTSAVLGFDLTFLRGDVVTTEPCVASAYAKHAAAKAEKSRRKAPTGACLAYDDDRHILVTTAAGDRAIPLLTLLGRSDGVARLLERLRPTVGDATETTIRTIRHNPGRRWVGMLARDRSPTLLLRAYDGNARMTRAASCYRALGVSDVVTPGLVARSRGLATMAVTWVDGGELDLSSGAQVWQAAGSALARLHASSADLPPSLAAGSGAVTVRRAGRQIARLLPDISGEVLEIARMTAEALERQKGDRVAVHGDFSADQVIVGPDGSPVLIDLDSAHTGTPAYDVGCLAASTLTVAETAGAASQGTQAVAAFLEGYDLVRRPPDEAEVAVHTAAFRLRKAIEPLRACAPDWREQVTARVAASRIALEDAPLARTRP